MNSKQRRTARRATQRTVQPIRLFGWPVSGRIDASRITAGNIFAYHVVPRPDLEPPPAIFHELAERWPDEKYN